MSILCGGDNDERKLTRRIAGNRGRSGHAALGRNSFVPPGAIRFVVLTANWGGMSGSRRIYPRSGSTAPLSLDTLGTHA